jgi:ankyrin repeat protein
MSEKHCGDYRDDNLYAIDEMTGFQDLPSVDIAAAFFKHLSFVAPGTDDPDIDMMKRHILDCLGSLFQIQRFRNSITNNAKSKVFYGALLAVSRAAVSEAEGKEVRNITETFLCDCFPGGAISHTGRAGREWMPIHWAGILDGITETDVRSLLELDPLGVTRVDCSLQQATPGHYAVAKSRPSMPIIRVMSASCPRMARIKDAQGCLLLHYGTSSKSAEVLQFLLQLYPAATRAQDDQESKTPLHILVHRDPFSEQVEMARNLLEADMGAALIADNEGDTALHILCRSKGKERASLVELMITYSPLSVSIRNKDGCLPLHCACQNKDSCDSTIISLLLQTYPEGASVADNDGLLPAHLAAEYSTVDVMENLIRAYPMALATNVSRYGTPLHQAAMRWDDGSTMVSYLHTRGPEAAHTQDNGWLPLHSASAYASLATIQAVYATNELAVQIGNDIGDLPLHLLLHSPHRDVDNPLSDDAAILRFLLREYPLAAGLFNSSPSGKETPYMISIRRGMQPYVRRLLLRAVPFLHPFELRHLNYAERRGAMFLAFSAIPRSTSNSFVLYLRSLTSDKGIGLLKNVVSFL